MLKYTLCYALFFSHLGSAQILNCDAIWMLPMTSPVELSAGFGDLRPNHFHMGIDIRTAGQVNLPIFAIGDGYVSRMKVSSVGYGWVLYIDHPNGYTSVYAHCNRFAERIQKVYLDTSCMLQNNEIDILLPPNKIQVQKGEQIAFSGNTGGSSGPHLHFEFRNTKSEEILNPLHFGFKKLEASFTIGFGDGDGEKDGAMLGKLVGASNAMLSIPESLAIFTCSLTLSNFFSISVGNSFSGKASAILSKLLLS
jgi:hypothetical protein